MEGLPLNGRNFMQLATCRSLRGDGWRRAGHDAPGRRQCHQREWRAAPGQQLHARWPGEYRCSPGNAAVILSQDAIQEFKVSSGTYSADQGFSATQINIVSKAGTNSLHGSVFWFDRNDAFDANPFPTVNTTFRAATGKPGPAPESVRVCRGRPHLIPKVYDGRNKSFFMANYEGGGSPTVPEKSRNAKSSNFGSRLFG